MVHALLVFLVLNTVSVYLVDEFLEGFVVTGGAVGYILVGVIIGFLNLILKPVLKLLSLPFLFLTIGLFMLLINAAILWLSVQIVTLIGITSIQLTIDGWGAYTLAVLFLGVLNYLFQKLFR